MSINRRAHLTWCLKGKPLVPLPTPPLLTPSPSSAYPVSLFYYSYGPDSILGSTCNSICLFVWLISLSTILSRFTHVAARNKIYWHIHYLVQHRELAGICLCTTGASAGAAVTPGRRVGWAGGPEGGDTCTHMTASRCPTAENQHSVVKRLYSSLRSWILFPRVLTPRFIHSFVNRALGGS